MLGMLDAWHLAYWGCRVALVHAESASPLSGVFLLLTYYPT